MQCATEAVEEEVVAETSEISAVGSEGRGVRAPRPLSLQRDVSVSTKEARPTLPFCTRTPLVWFIPQFARFSVTELGLVSEIPLLQDGSKLMVLGDDKIEVRGAGRRGLDPFQ